MKLNNAYILALAAAAATRSAEAFRSSSSSLSSPVFGHNSVVRSSPSSNSVLRVSATAPAVVAEETGGSSSEESQNDGGPTTYADVQSLPFRALRRSCKEAGLSAGGTTAALRGRLLEHLGIETAASSSAAAATSSSVEVTATAAEIEELCATDGITFCDESDPDFDFKSLLSEVMQKSSVGHWKAATRKLKALDKRHATPERPVPREAYIAVLEACAAQRLNGARAAEPARKILEDMVTRGYDVPAALADECVMNCVGDGPSGTHDGFGGIDAALAMVAAVESAEAKMEGGTEEEDATTTTTTTTTTKISEAAYGRLVTALARDGAVEEAVLVLRSMVAEKNFTPQLDVLASVAMAAAKSDDVAQAEQALQVLSYAKAAGYELDSVASVEAGQILLAAGVIVAEKMNNLALGLRLLTAAGKAQGCAPDTGDGLVATSSSAAQRACTLIHRKAIYAACGETNWKLAVKILELMPKRGLTPATSVWRNVLTVCCKKEKSRKATAILLDWVTLAKEGKADTPPVQVFNTVVNTCEVCGEEELTVKVLEVMKETLDTEGNIITFNIALKRLAKTGNVLGCEGILVGMLSEGIEPNVVSYTTTMGACAKEGFKNAPMAYTWLQRMRSRNVSPNYHTYNTALASCLDGTLESTKIASQVAAEMVSDAEFEVTCGMKGKGSANYASTLPDQYTKVLARKLTEQLRQNWRDEKIDIDVAKSTLRVPLLKLLDFDKDMKNENMDDSFCELTDEENEAMDLQKAQDEDQQLEFNLLSGLHKDDHRTAMV